MAGDPKVLDVAYDLDAHPGADAFDPIEWFEGTGEAVDGLPDWYVKWVTSGVKPANLAELMAEYKAGLGNPDG
jgi:hypothetical protein